MKTVLKTAPVNDAVSVEEAKEHLRLILGDTTDDEYLKVLIDLATGKVEQFLEENNVCLGNFVDAKLFKLGNVYQYILYYGIVITE